MWANSFSGRLSEWSRLRAECSTLDNLLALSKINQWWHTSPWCPYRLHWNDIESWPNPWEILDDNIYCPITRALGIIYTIGAIKSITLDVNMVEFDSGDTLVLVNNGDMILNWTSNTIINIDLSEYKMINSKPLSYFLEKF